MNKKRDKERYSLHKKSVPSKRVVDSKKKAKIRLSNEREKDLNFSFYDSREGGGNRSLVTDSAFYTRQLRNSSFSKIAQKLDRPRHSSVARSRFDKDIMLRKGSMDNRTIDLKSYKHTRHASCQIDDRNIQRSEHFSKEMLTFYKIKDYDAAIKCGEEILKENRNSLDALYIVGLCSAMLEKSSKTAECFERLIAIEPNYKKTVYLFLSISLKKLGREDRAAEVLTQALEYFPGFYEAHVFQNPNPRSIGQKYI